MVLHVMLAIKWDLPQDPGRLGIGFQPNLQDATMFGRIRELAASLDGRRKSVLSFAAEGLQFIKMRGNVIHLVHSKEQFASSQRVGSTSQAHHSHVFQRKLQPVSEAVHIVTPRYFVVARHPPRTAVSFASNKSVRMGRSTTV
ncbi:hypothetical protein NEMBOFW57_001610 [Staphylotrichum longicolle]|uniref:Uncharacterized protein n=1 Tax=Staphylotrichum longicolle TaxID=669026 RepID=A0AAD4F201_9PEZI|nr:hypothetical protein NEMBOFW57_001610 [Staphylotrichum longicolle]